MNEASDNIFLSAPVEPEDKGMRLDKFLARAFSGISRSQLQRLIAAGCVTCDDDISFMFPRRPTRSRKLRIFRWKSFMKTPICWWSTSLRV